MSDKTYEIKCDGGFTLRVTPQTCSVVDMSLCDFAARTHNGIVLAFTVKASEEEVSDGISVGSVPHTIHRFIR